MRGVGTLIIVGTLMIWISEWAVLSQMLTNYQLHHSDDKWFWKLEPSGIFSTKSLITFKHKTNFKAAEGSYKTIWSGSIP